MEQLRLLLVREVVAHGTRLRKRRERHAVGGVEVWQPAVAVAEADARQPPAVLRRHARLVEPLEEQLLHRDVVVADRLGTEHPNK